MKTKSLSFTTILGFLGLLLMIHAVNGHAAVKCETAFGEKQFTISDERVSFDKADGANRSISSVDSVRTQKKNSGFTKTLYIDGNKHRIHIDNANEFSDVNDYLSITSPKGHEMTYPLSCHSV